MRHIANFLQNFSLRSGLKGKLSKALFRPMLAGFAAVDTDLQQTQEVQTSLAEQAAASRQQYLEMQQTLQAMQAQLDALAAQQAMLAAQMQDLEPLSVNVRNNNAQLAALQSETELLKVKLAGLQRMQAAAPAPAAEAARTAPAVSEAARSDYDTIDYFDFENHFRGSMEAVREAQRVYLPYFQGKKQVLDIGCGRGEFLDLMRENGIPARGVDVYAPYVDYCTMRGLDAVCGDGIAHLQNDAAPADGIFVGQVVEHLRTEQIVALCHAAYETLPEGGCIVIETPNPTSLAIYTNAFYIDPSHVKPVHPLTMQYFLKKAGFSRIELLYTEGSRPPGHIPPLQLPDEENAEAFNEAMHALSELLYGSQDYAVIAIK